MCSVRTDEMKKEFSRHQDSMTAMFTSIFTGLQAILPLMPKFTPIEVEKSPSNALMNTHITFETAVSALFPIDGIFETSASPLKYDR